MKERNLNRECYKDLSSASRAYLREQEFCCDELGRCPQSTPAKSHLIETESYWLDQDRSGGLSDENIVKALLCVKDNFLQWPKDEQEYLIEHREFLLKN